MTQAKPKRKLKLITIPRSPGDPPVRETDKAFAVHLDQVNSMQWFPKSQIEDLEILPDKVSFWCPDWLIHEKLIEAFVDTSYEPSLFD